MRKLSKRDSFYFEMSPQETETRYNEMVDTVNTLIDVVTALEERVDFLSESPETLRKLPKGSDEG